MTDPEGGDAIMHLAPALTGFWGFEATVKPFIFGALLVAALAGPVAAQVRIDIGVQLPGPPLLVVIPGTPVYYAPRAPANVFFYAHQYWIFAETGWHVGPGWNGPWAVVQPAYVPVPLLQISIGHYPVPPPPWRGRRPNERPPWDAHYGREWREATHERDWRENEERWDKGKGKSKGCPPGLAKQGRC